MAQLSGCHPVHLRIASSLFSWCFHWCDDGDVGWCAGGRTGFLGKRFRCCASQSKVKILQRASPRMPSPRWCQTLDWEGVIFRAASSGNILWANWTFSIINLHILHYQWLQMPFSKCFYNALSKQIIYIKKKLPVQFWSGHIPQLGLNPQ